MKKTVLMVAFSAWAILFSGAFVAPLITRLLFTIFIVTSLYFLLFKDEIKSKKELS